MIRGGHLQDVPLPHRRRWPGDPEPRDVVIKILTWAGLAPGAIHFHVDLYEEDNPIWDSRSRADVYPELYQQVLNNCAATGKEMPLYWSEPNGWRACWDDKEGKGLKETTIYDSVAAAVAAVRQIIAERYSDGSWQIRSTATDETIDQYLDRIFAEWSPRIKRARREGD